MLPKTARTENGQRSRIGNVQEVAIAGDQDVTSTFDRRGEDPGIVGIWIGVEPSFFGLAITSSPRSKSRMSFVVLAGSLKRLASTSWSSSRTTSPVTNRCSAST